MTIQNSKTIVYRPFLFALTLLAFCFLCKTSIAAETPEFVRLLPFEQGVNAPTSLALDNDGRLYVAETSHNRIVILSQGGTPVGTIKGLAKPISVAVAGNGRIFVGNNAKGNVEVYDSGFNFLFKLGQGDREFSRPNAIAIDPTDRVYVTDTQTNIIKIYNPDGSYQSSLGSPGIGDGEFTNPVSLVFDPVAFELIVLDIPQPVTGRVQVFDFNGTFLRSFTNSLDDGGQITRPQHITVDNQGRLYLTDSFEQKVFVYDENGTHLSTITDDDHPLRTPLGIVINDTNRLYIASLRTHSVEVYGIDHFTNMDVKPARLTFTTKDREGAPPPQAVTITNSGNQSFDYTTFTDTDWINLSLAEFTVQPSGTSLVDVIVNPVGLGPGIYTGSINITADGMVTERIDVVLNVLAAAYLYVDRGSLTYRSTVGSTPLAQLLSINNLGSRPLNWRAWSSDEWIVIHNGSGTTPESGTEPDSLTVLIDVSAFAAGIYTGTITISDSDAVASPVTVEVILILEAAPVDPPPDDRVTVKVGDMSWTVSENLPDTSLKGVWGSSESSIFIVGEYGLILQYDGQDLSPMHSYNPETLHAIWGSSSENAFAVGDSGAVLHYDGETWEISIYAQQSLLDVWGSSAANILSVGTRGGILNDFLTNWTITTPDSSHSLKGIWGNSDSNIYAVGDTGTILRYDGHTWTTMSSDTQQSLSAIWGSSNKDIFAVGDAGVILHYDGQSWNSMPSGTEEPLHAVWGSDKNNVLAVGGNGTIVHYDGLKWKTLPPITSNNLWDIWGTGSGSDLTVIAVGDNGTILHGKGLNAFPWFLFSHLIEPPSENGEN